MPSAVISAGIGALIVGALVLCAGTAAHAQHCEIIGCWTDCRPVPGGRYCQRYCRRRCWNPPPARYQPRVQASQVAQPPPPVSPPDPGLLIVVLGGIALVILIVVAAAAEERAAVDRLHTATDATRSDAQQADALAAKATMTAHEIDRYIAQQIAQAYDRGRDSLPEPRHER